MSDTNIEMETSKPMITPGSADGPHEENPTKGIPASFRNNHHHRRLAVCSIVCGLTCIGILALTHSVKAEHAQNRKEEEEHSKKAKKFSIISIVTWVSILISIPILLAFFSFLATLKDY
ncbi:transmembrane protein 265 [Kryptolebias marmoratus]|uniref:transmembrane protein 265 n=1 Tax=Kryptolebias marmoratus TaxID=37003 RepID=UPI0007F8EE28|nr:transmembrane protein 265 [Kryptolebias marmoratus]